MTNSSLTIVSKHINIGYHSTVWAGGWADHIEEAWGPFAGIQGIRWVVVEQGVPARATYDAACGNRALIPPRHLAEMEQRLPEIYLNNQAVMFTHERVTHLSISPKHRDELIQMLIALHIADVGVAIHLEFLPGPPDGEWPALDRWVENGEPAFASSLSITPWRDGRAPKIPSRKLPLQEQPS